MKEINKLTKKPLTQLLLVVFLMSKYIYYITI